VALGPELLARHVEAEERGAVLRRPLPRDEAGLLVAPVAADAEVVDADAVRAVLVGVDVEEAMQVALVGDAVLVEHRVLEEEVVGVERADLLAAGTERLQPLHGELVIHGCLSSV
jgi:hypothetical protein